MTCPYCCFQNKDDLRLQFAILPIILYHDPYEERDISVLIRWLKTLYWYFWRAADWLTWMTSMSWEHRLILVGAALFLPGPSYGECVEAWGRFKCKDARERTGFMAASCKTNATMEWKRLNQDQSPSMSQIFVSFLICIFAFFLNFCSNQRYIYSNLTDMSCHALLSCLVIKS